MVSQAPTDTELIVQSILMFFFHSSHGWYVVARGVGGAPGGLVKHRKSAQWTVFRIRDRGPIPLSSAHTIGSTAEKPDVEKISQRGGDTRH